MIRKIYSGVLMITSLCASYGYYYGEYGGYDQIFHHMYWQDGFKVTLDSKEHYMKIHKDYTKHQLEYQIDNFEKQELTTRDGTELYSSLNVMETLVDLAWKLNEKGVTSYFDILDGLNANAKKLSAAQLNSAILLVHMVDYFKQLKEVTSTEKHWIKYHISEPNGYRTFSSFSKFIWPSIKNFYLPETVSLDNLEHDFNFYWNIFGGCHWCEVKFAYEMRYNKKDHMNITSEAISELLDEEEKRRKEYYAKLNNSSNSAESPNSETKADSSDKEYSDEWESRSKTTEISYDDSSSDTEDNSSTEDYNFRKEQNKAVIILDLQNKIAEPQTTKLEKAVQKAMEWSQENNVKYEEKEINYIASLIAEGNDKAINTELSALIFAAQEDFLERETISNYFVTDDDLKVDELLYNLGDWLRMRSFIAIGIIRRIYNYCYDKTKEAIKEHTNKTSIKTMVIETGDFFSICDILCAPERILDYIVNIFSSNNQDAISIQNKTIGYAKTLIGLEEEDLKKIFKKLLEDIDITQITDKDIDSILSSFTAQKVANSESLENIVESNMQALSNNYIIVAKKIIDNVYENLSEQLYADLISTFYFLLCIAYSIPEETDKKDCDIAPVTEQIIEHISSKEDETHRLKQSFNTFINNTEKISKLVDLSPEYQEKAKQLAKKVVDLLSKKNGIMETLKYLKKEVPEIIFSNLEYWIFHK